MFIICLLKRHFVIDTGNKMPAKTTSKIIVTQEMQEECYVCPMIPDIYIRQSV